jgi:PAS domain S-box-containing protein
VKTTKKVKSLYTTLGIIVVAVVFVVMLSFLTYHYHNTHKKLFEELQTQSYVSLMRLSDTIVPFIESYSINEYEKLLLHEMSNEDIYAIVVEDYYMGAVVGSNIFYSGKVRDNIWTPIQYNHNDKKHHLQIKQSFYFVESILQSSKGKVLGKITLYYSDKFMNKELSSLIKKSIFITFLVALVLIVVLFFTIKKYILQPIETIIETISNQDQDGLPVKTIEVSSSKEMVFLTTTLNNMIQTIKQSKQQLKELNQRFELTLDAVKDGIWDWDIMTDKAYFSKRWKEMLGYLENDIENTGKAFFALIHPQEQAKVQKLLEEHFINPLVNDYAVEIRLLCKNGTYKWILSRGKAILDRYGKPTRMLGYHSDITAQKQNQEYLKQQERMLAEQSKLAAMGEMIGNIAHQWRQPLGVITSTVSNIKMKNELGIAVEVDEMNEVVDEVVKQAKYLSKTIDDFRNFLKADKQKVVFNLSDMVYQLLSLLHGAIKSNNIEVVYTLDDSLSITSYQNELIQSLINLFNNAKDAMKSQKEKIILLSIYKKNKTVYIEFQDNGGGIQEDIISKIFEPYFTTKHQSQGTGLGLHMTYNLITQSMEGKIYVENSEFLHNSQVYYGAKFIIELPMSLDS